MRSLITLILCIFLVMFLGCGDNDEEDNDSENDVKSIALDEYVILGVSGGEPAFSFPKDPYSSSSVTMSNIRYDDLGRVIGYDEEGDSYSASYYLILRNPFGQVTSFSFHIAFHNGNTYYISVSDISRNSMGYVVSYATRITASLGGRELSGTLTFPD